MFNRKKSVSDFSNAIKDKKLPKCAHIVLDEAYFNREQELSPFKGRDLDLWKDSFNYLICLRDKILVATASLLFKMMVQLIEIAIRVLRNDCASRLCIDNFI